MEFTGCLLDQILRGDALAGGEGSLRINYFISTFVASVLCKAQASSYCKHRERAGIRGRTIQRHRFSKNWQRDAPNVGPCSP